MAHDARCVVRKKSTWWSLLKALIILAAISYAAYKIYLKFFQKKKNDLLDGVPEADELPASSEAIADPEVVFEASAADVIADSVEQED